jgi:hypothetical protein
MFYYLFNLIFITPSIEWGIHRLFHICNNKFHKEHHIEVHNGTNQIESYFLLIIYLLYLLDYEILTLGGIQYLVNHTLIHFYPKYCNKEILKHHLIHHNKPNYNFSVSNPFIDNLFNTRYIE